MDTIIKVKDLKKYYKDVKAVDGVSFEVKKGELFGFLGINGAGKSTTINILCTLLEETSGDVSICGYNLKNNSKKIREKIGIVFQENTMDDFLTIRENLTLRASLYCNDNAFINNKILEVADILDINSILDRKFKNLSGGQKRKCEIAKALINAPEILFLDEPTTGLDPQTRKFLWQSIEKLRRDKNMTIFLTTHYMEEAEKANHICIMDEGRVLVYGEPSTLKEIYTRDTLRIFSIDKDNIVNYAEDMKLDYIVNTNSLDIKLNNTKHAINILNDLQYYIDSFEVIQGNMDELFLNITGKKLEG